MVLINDNSKVLALDSPLPHFELPSVDGSTIDSQKITEPVLVIIFTCNHCPYAQAYEDRIIDIAKEFHQKGAFIVLINSNDATDYPDDSYANMQMKAKEKGYFFPYCHDETQEVARSFGALCTPHCFVFNLERRLQYKGRVDDNWKDSKVVKEQNVRDAISALVAGKKPPKQEANAIGCSIKWK